MKNSLILGFIMLLVSSVNAQTTLLDESFSNGIPSDWTVVDNDGGVVDASVSTFTEGWIGYETSFDTCAASTSFFQDSDSLTIADDYLVTPPVNLLSFGSLLTWQSKSFDASYLESYYVLVSTTDNDINSFTDTIKIVNSAVPFWKSYSINLLDKGYADQTVYIAFKSASHDKFILGIDEVKLTTNDPANIEQNNENEFSIYPNPVVSTLFISIQNDADYLIYDQTGKLCLSDAGNQIDVSTLNKGVYYISIKNDSGIDQKLFIKE